MDTAGIVVAVLARWTNRLGPAKDHRRQTGSTSIAFWRQQRQNGAMPSVQIKDVPEDTHRVLRERAARAHQSLQEYLRSRLIAEASQPTVEEVLARVESRSGGKVPTVAAVQHIRAERDRR